MSRASDGWPCIVWGPKAYCTLLRLVNAFQDDGDTPLALAAFRGHLDAPGPLLGVKHSSCLGQGNCFRRCRWSWACTFAIFSLVSSWFQIPVVRDFFRCSGVCGACPTPTSTKTSFDARLASLQTQLSVLASQFGPLRRLRESDTQLFRPVDPRAGRVNRALKAQVGVGLRLWPFTYRRW